jgi:hypothetical protein
VDTQTLITGTASFESIHDKLRCVPQYAGKASIRLQEVPTQVLLPLCLFVRSYRLEPVRQLIRLYRQAGIALFEGVWVEQKGSLRLLLPPIIEAHEGQHIIIDGLHRIHEMRLVQQPAVRVVVISGVAQPVPADVVAWSEVQMTDQELPRAQKFRNLDESRFREINRYIDDFH